MQRTITATGLLTLVAMIAVGVFAAGSASAVSQFLWTGPLPALLLVLNDNPQAFSAEAGVTVVCQHFGGHGIVTNGKAMTAKELVITGLYSKCKLTEPIVAEAEVSPAEFKLNADGTISVLKEITITIGALACNLKVKAEAANQNLKSIRYLQDPANANAILAHAEIVGITSFGSAPPCGELGVAKPNGTYFGLLLAFIHGGAIKWDP